MSQLRIGILGAADVALRYFLPALASCDDIEFVGVASRTPEKAQEMASLYGGSVYDSYDSLLEDSSIDAVYIPLPPAFHGEWARKAIKSKKHIFMEKPFTISEKETKSLVQLAKKNQLALHENYAFLYHPQLNWIKHQMEQEQLGELRLIRCNYSYPQGDLSHFRYRKELGGGALLECGGFPLRLVTHLLGKNLIVDCVNLQKTSGIFVDMYGSATLRNAKNQVAQISFGLDNASQSNVELVFSKGILKTGEIFTPKVGIAPEMTVEQLSKTSQVSIMEVDHFKNSLLRFARSVAIKDHRDELYQDILYQAKLMEMLK